MPLFYLTLEAALIDGCRFVNVPSDEYIEELTYENGKFIVKHCSWGNCRIVKSDAHLKNILRIHKFKAWDFGHKKIVYSLDAIKEQFEMLMTSQFPKDWLDHNAFSIDLMRGKDGDPYTNYEFVASKHKNPSPALNLQTGQKIYYEERYDIEIKELHRYGFGRGLHVEICHSESDARKAFVERVVPFLKKEELIDMWCKEVDIRYDYDKNVYAEVK